MKKSIFFLLFVPLHLLAQNITNTLGTDGSFILEDNANNSIFVAQRLTASTARIIFGDYSNTFNLPTGNFDFIQNEGGESVNIIVGRNGMSTALPKLQFFFTPGALDAPTNVSSTNVLGQINFGGYFNGWRTDAYINAEVQGAPGSSIPTALHFGTRDASSSAFNDMVFDAEGNLTVPSAITAQAIRTVNTSITLGNTDQTIIATDAITITLPTPSAALKGKTYSIKANTASTVTIGGNNVESLGGLSLTGGDCVTYQCDGNGWFIINYFDKP